MKTRIFLVAMALVVFASLSFGQGFCRFLYDDATMLTVNSDGTGGPLPDGTMITIYWDSNGNGIDPNDPLACTIPEPCVVNYCEFPMNGGAVGLGEGYFIADLDFCSVGCLPTPATFYFAINCPTTGEHLWITPAMTFTSGPADLPLYVWNPGVPTCGTPPACDPPQPQTVTITAAGGGDPQMLSECLHLCADATTVLSICSGDGHPWNPAAMPVSTWHPGCDLPCGDPNCTPGDAIVTGPVYNTATGCWDYVIVGMADNTCFCFTFDHFLAVGFNNDFTPVAHDKSVDMSWSTSSETNLVRFEIVRGTEVVGRVDAKNAGSTYTFTDNTVNNGTSYTYTLRYVDGNNVTTDLQTVEGVTPSFNAAVITEYALHQNFPNPFNPSTEIAFDVLNPNPVTLKVYNAAGQEVATLLNGAAKEKGRYVVNFDASNLTSGIYFYTVKMGNEFSATKKMLLVK